MDSILPIIELAPLSRSIIYNYIAVDAKQKIDGNFGGEKGFIIMSQFHSAVSATRFD